MKLLFVALSDSQETYYKSLAEHKGIQAKVIRIKHFKHGSFLKGLKWVKDNKLNAMDWLTFKLLKSKSKKIIYLFSSLVKYALFVDMLRFLDAFHTVFIIFKPDALIVLNGAHYKQQAAINLAENFQTKVIFIELGCLPNTTMVDDQGVNANASIPRDKKFYQNYRNTSEYHLSANLVPRESKVPKQVNQNLPDKFIFVPFQVHDDTQVLLQSPWIVSMWDLYQKFENALTKLHADYSIVFKEHPSDTQRYPELYEKNSRLIFANGNDTQELIEQAAAVVTINSTVGIEALLFKKPTITLGNAFYNVDSMVYMAENQKILNNLLESPNQLKFNNELTSKFFHYLSNTHLVFGKPKNYDQQHLQDMILLIKRFIIKSN